MHCHVVLQRVKHGIWLLAQISGKVSSDSARNSVYTTVRRTGIYFTQEYKGKLCANISLW